jgi:hypothetical protein
MTDAIEIKVSPVLAKQNQSTAFLVDEYGDLTARLKVLEDEREIVAAALKARIQEDVAKTLELKKKGKEAKVPTLDGKIFKIDVSTFFKSTLDRAAVIKKLGEKWVDRNSKETPVVQLRSKAIAAEK